MFSIFKRDVRYCPQVEREVSTRQTLEECRQAHHCAQAGCPLAGEFTGIADIKLTMAEFRSVRD